MTIIKISKLARSDLLKINTHIAEHNPKRANSFIDELLHRINQLTDAPMSGPARPEIEKHLRVIVFHDYLIFYRSSESGIQLVRIIHGSRGLDKVFHRK